MLIEELKKIAVKGNPIGEPRDGSRELNSRVYHLLRLQEQLSDVFVRQDELQSAIVTFRATQVEGVDEAVEDRLVEIGGQEALDILQGLLGGQTPKEAAQKLWRGFEWRIAGSAVHAVGLAHELELGIEGVQELYDKRKEDDAPGHVGMHCLANEVTNYTLGITDELDIEHVAKHISEAVWFACKVFGQAYGPNEALESIGVHDVGESALLRATDNSTIF